MRSTDRLAPPLDLRPLTGGGDDYDGLLELIEGSSLVLIGEASHGTHEFYRERARITRRLIEEQGFRAVAVEADWPDAYRVNRYLHGAPQDADAEEALRGFRRFPTWMWRNAEVLDFLGWLRSHNDRGDAGAAVSFFGLDVYSLFASIDAVVSYLDGVDPAAAARARRRYACFEHFGGEQVYGRAAALGVADSCRREVVAQLTDLQGSAERYLRHDGIAAEDEQFCAEQNARVVSGAERYYRAMFEAPVSSWNLRDRHMADTLERLSAHLARHGTPPKIVVWEHNSHVGDARTTAMGRRGELNVGQLVRERRPEDAFLVGLTTHSGSVTAASAWDAPAERKRVRPALPGSWEELFHEAGEPRFWLDLSAQQGSGALAKPRLERAIGVIYRPESERQSHYFEADLARQFDAVIHVDETRAVEPLERTAGWELGEPPETYPTAL
ncbi:MAG TPA: erythromycin esterase family protein [Solirubrobacterales bacterium]|nr:erythromycin esterase family protein [Solirubrobacterales bacterium]